MKRIKNLIDHVAQSNQKTKDDDIPTQHLSTRNSASVTEFFNNPLGDREVIQSIDEIYYGTADDTSVFELKKLPSNPSKELVNEMRENLQIRLCAVTKKLSGVILQNQPAYQKELQRVQELQEILQVAFTTCHSGKQHLLSASETLNVRLLVDVQHRKNLRSLQVALETIKTLEHTDVRLRELLEDEHYPEAIQLCLECQKAAVIYKQYSCIKDLSSKLQDTIELIEEQIDVALSKICDHFDKKMYEKLQTSYKLLGKPQTAIDQLLMHFTSCIHNTAFQTVLGFVKLCSTETQTNLHKKQFGNLCSSVDVSVYIPCLLALCKALWNIMNCYHKASKWHSEEFENQGGVSSGEVEFDLRYRQQKLEHGRHRVWLDVQSRVRGFLLGTDLSSFKYDEFIRVLDIVKKLVSIGKAFCDDGVDKASDEEEVATSSFVQNLHEPIYQQSLRYFHTYHRKCMDELHMFLENEAWESCPIKSNFSLLQLPEFDFLHEATYKDIVKSPFHENGPNQARHRFSFSNFSSAKTHPFSEFEGKSPTNGASTATFRSATHGDMSDDEEVADELLQDFVDDDPEDAASLGRATPKQKIVKGPILTNAALNILRICGKYLKMCDVLRPIAMDVIICMSQLFDYYLFSVYNFFVDFDSGTPMCSEKLSAALRRIESDLIYHDDPNGAWSNGTGRDVKVPLPSISPIVDLHNRGTLFGFLHRVTATESLVNLSKQFETIKPNLEKLVPSGKQAFLHQFYSQTISTCPEVRSQVFYAIAAKSVDYASVLAGMAQVKWDIRDIMSQHSRYIDDLVHQFKLLKIQCNSAADGYPGEISEVIWKHCIMLANRTLVEGYSNVRKCSNEGRALMQLDFQQFLLKVDEVTKIRPIPGKDLVEGYIKAFYLTEEDLELWMKNHPEYSEKQLSVLIHSSAASTVGSTTKKNKQRMLSLIDDLTSRR